MTDKQNTHLLISEKLVGSVVTIEKNKARVELTPLKEMAADNLGLLHGGFIFGLADYAAMLAVNRPYVVLGKAEVKFIKPVTINENLVAVAKIIDIEGCKYEVNVNVYNCKDEIVFNGTFVCFDKNKHVLE